MPEFRKQQYAKKLVSEADKAKWGRYWYGRLRDFIKAGTGSEWRFTEAHVVVFLRHLLADNVPAWKRLKVVENLTWYRDEVLKTDEPKMEFVRRKLKETIALEKGIDVSDEPLNVTMTMEVIEEIAGIIDPNEPEPLQATRRKIRLEHKAFATEEAYVRFPSRFERMFHQLVARDRWHGVLLGKPATRLADDQADAPFIDSKRIARMCLDLAPSKNR